MRVLVFGGAGQLGRELRRAAWPGGADVAFLERDAADLRRPASLGPIVRAHAPDIVVIAAAYTAVDRAESEPDVATAVNAEAPGAIAEAAAGVDAATVYVSTDYVFDGEKDSPYFEDDPVAPLGVYGRSKEAGERAVRAANPRHLILRTSWVHSAFGQNFVRTMLRLAETRDEVTIVDDQLGCPTAAGDLARTIVALAPALARRGTEYGTFHAAGATATSWHGFAEAIFAELDRRGRPRPRNRPIPTSAYPTPARRPANSRLDSGKLARTFGLRLPGFEAALPVVLDELLAGDGGPQF